MVDDVAGHRPDQHAPAHRRRERFGEFTDLGPSCQCLRAQVGECRFRRLDSPPEFGVLGAEPVRLASVWFVVVGRHRISTVPAG